MASRSRTTFKKRQKEIARMEKQRDKAARRQQRRAEKQAGHHEPEPEVSAEAESSEAIDTASTTTA